MADMNAITQAASLIKSKKTSKKTSKKINKAMSAHQAQLLADHLKRSALHVPQKVTTLPKAPAMDAEDMLDGGADEETEKE